MTATVDGTKPTKNVLILCADMAGAHHYGCYDPNISFTPNTDALAAGGAVFERAYCACPPCIPTRVSMFTGQYGHTHGKSAHLKMPLRRQPAVLPTILADAGYRTAIAGKTHWWPSDTDFGCDEAHLTIDNHLTPELGRKDAYIQFLESQGLFRYDPDEWEGFREKLNPNKLPFESLKANWLGDTTCDIIERFAADEAPFFIFSSFVEPHGPGKTPDWYTDQLRDFYLPPLIQEPDGGAGKPATQRRAMEQWSKPADVVEQTRLEVFAAIKLVDDNIGKIMATLDRVGCADSTLVVFVTDHGDLLFDHGCIEKTFLYESAVRIPFLVRGPDIPAGSRYSHLVSQIDLLPTVLDHCGIAVNPDWNVEGRSVLPVARGESPTWRQTVYCETDQTVHLRDLVGSSTAKMAFRPPWKYIYTLVNGHIVEEELYNLEDDPYELSNKAGDTAHADVVTGLRNDVLRWLVATEPNRFNPAAENHYKVPRVAQQHL